MNAVAQFLAEAELGCLMANVDPADAVNIIEWTHANIAPEVLADDGYDPCPHVTVLYGFEADVTPGDIRKALALKKLCRVSFQLGVISRFDTNPEYDVLKIAAVSDDLHVLNAHLVQYFGDRVTQTFPEFHPHLTLAYVRKGACAHLDGHAKFSGNIYSLKHLIYSLPESKAKMQLAVDGSSGA